MFLLLAYRQEAYAAEAVRAALAQEGPPLDILISDDCSPDGTWSVIEQAVDGYQGPHNVVLNRNPQNLGVSAHIDKVLSETAAEHVIVAAADDISWPDRAKRQLEAFEAPDVVLVHSEVTAIDKTGAVSDFRPTPKFVQSTAPEVAARSLGLYVGATGAWHRSLWTKFPKMRDGVFEDLVFGFRAAILGEVAYVADPLVQYRVNVGQSAVVPDTMSREDWRSQRRRELQRGLWTFEQRRADATAIGLGRSSTVMRTLRSKEAEYAARLSVLGRAAGDVMRTPQLWSPLHLRCWRSEMRRETQHVSH